MSKLASYIAYAPARPSGSLQSVTKVVRTWFEHIRRHRLANHIARNGSNARSYARNVFPRACRLPDGRAGAYAMYEANLLTKWLFQPTTYSSVLIWLLPRAITPLIHGQLRPFRSCFEAQDPLCQTYLALFQPSSSDREISALKNRSFRNHFFNISIFVKL